MFLQDKKFLILGSKGQLAAEFQSYFTQRNISFNAPPEFEANITDDHQIEELITEFKPHILINCAAYNAVDHAEDNPDLAYSINYEAVKNLTKLCKTHHIFFVHYSSDYVFDGTKGSPYTEEDAPNPLNIYGKSKLKGEEVIPTLLADFLIFRLSWVIGKGHQNFLYKLSQWAQNNSELKISSDEISVPTFTKDIVDITLKSLNKELTGLYHLTNSDYVSRYILAKTFIKLKGLPNTVIPVPMDTFPAKASRPKFSAMSNAKISNALNIIIPTWEERLEKYEQ